LPWQGPDLVIHQSEEVLAGMNAWCQEHHGASGLTQKVRDSSTTLQEAEDAVLDFITQHTEYQSAQLAGNSVHIDRLFLLKHMPKVVEHLHYRIIDVSTIMELSR
jgi:oligoribonuclease